MFKILEFNPFAHTLTIVGANFQICFRAGSNFNFTKLI